MQLVRDINGWVSIYKELLNENRVRNHKLSWQLLCTTTC